MTLEKKLGRARRFGARCGRKLKLKFAAIESDQKKQYKCPYCNVMKVKRLSVGIWNCKKCSSKFTGKAYSLFKTTTEDLEEKEDKEVKENKPIEKEAEV